MTPDDPTTLPLRDRVLACVMAHGAHATAFQVLEPGYEHWFDTSGALISFVRKGRVRVCAGPPIGPPDALLDATRRFTQDAQNTGERVVFFCIDAQNVDALSGDEMVTDALHIGAQPIWDPRKHTLEGRRRRTLRAQVRRASRKGVQARRVTPDELSEGAPLRLAMSDCLDAWRASRRMSVMGFMVDVRLFHLPHARRHYVAEHDGRVVALLAAAPIPTANGWFFEDLIRHPDAPNGTIELLIHTAMEGAREEAAHLVTLGLAPLADIPAGPGPHRAWRALMRGCYRHLGALYGFESLHRFKSRFDPDAWQPQYLLTTGRTMGPWAMDGVLRAFAGGSVLSFGLDTSRRLLKATTARTWAWIAAAVALIMTLITTLTLWLW